MNKNDLAEQMGELLKLIRTEYNLNQDEMAVALGISKKTLVETEKGRRTLSWTEAVAMAALFSGSQVLQNTFGGDTDDILQAVAFQNLDIRYPKTMGGKVWWRTIDEKGAFRIQQNIISHHYRLLNGDNQRILSSFNEADVRQRLQEELQRDQ